MTAWRNASIGYFWAVKLDVRDLGGHLGVTHRALAGALCTRAKDATSQVIAVGALSMEFQRMLGMVCSTYLPAGLHGCEESALSVSAHDRINRLLDCASVGSPRHGPIQLLISSALETGFSWDSEQAG